MDEPGTVQGHTAAYRVIGDLDFATTPEIYYAVDRLALAPGLGVLVLDLTEVAAMDSSGLAVLVLAHNRALQRGFRLLIRGTPPRVARLLALTGLDSVLQHADPASRHPPMPPDAGAAHRSRTRPR